MAPVWTARVERADSFTQDLVALRSKFPEIDSVIQDFEDALRLGHGLPHVPVSGTASVYATLADYPPHGSAGLGVFLVTYHRQLHAYSPMQGPPATFSLLTITER